MEHTSLLYRPIAFMGPDCRVAKPQVVTVVGIINSALIVPADWIKSPLLCQLS
jgi:hypothetical protein